MQHTSPERNRNGSLKEVDLIGEELGQMRQSTLLKDRPNKYKTKKKLLDTKKEHDDEK